jgi:hypothetical protein
MKTMNTKLFFMAVAFVSAFGIAVTGAGPFTVTTPAIAQNTTDTSNMTTFEENMTAVGNTTTGGNWTK